ncbi:MAG: DNA-binding protein [Hydrocarboniphaga sp.]|uniref:Zn-ribbon domain-containing OB-fold protein n=1 Tax=Hydrocarboniphaga sp. TaxID=2033016 RepID=UPI002624E70F|nr:Zn-ribbon domain-containing OB-fold protein [Hydrocarboniphaga sp.]MDB5967863.1 DNA-binding protein [Hydrocarboniphaga sp.]
MTRALPQLTPLTEPFWKGGADGQLRLQRCAACQRFMHPPRPICINCYSRELTWEVISGRGVVESFTINHQPWRPDLKDPYVIAIVSLAEQSDLRLTTNIIGCDADKVHIGLVVQVRFVAIEDVYLPMFEPAVLRLPIAL